VTPSRALQVFDLFQVLGADKKVWRGVVDAGDDLEYGAFLSDGDDAVGIEGAEIDLAAEQRLQLYISAANQY
jgi:hypothetical protein